jgi:hypothetical protein
VIDDYPVVANYIDPPEMPRDEHRADNLEESWKAKHVRQSQYLIQIVKCPDNTCCKEFRTNYAKYFPAR